MVREEAFMNGMLWVDKQGNGSPMGRTGLRGRTRAEKAAREARSPPPPGQTGATCRQSLE